MPLRPTLLSSASSNADPSTGVTGAVLRNHSETRSQALNDPDNPKSLSRGEVRGGVGGGSFGQIPAPSALEGLDSRNLMLPEFKSRPLKQNTDDRTSTTLSYSADGPRSCYGGSSLGNHPLQHESVA